MDKLICVTCSGPRQIGRKVCRACHLSLARKRAKDRNDKFGRHFLLKDCVACKAAFKAWRQKQILCPSCYKQSLKTGFQKNKYLFETKTSKNKHRVLAEKLLGRKLSYHEVIHHIDENPSNNSLDNLMLMTREAHGKLHKFLRGQRVIWEKSQNENLVNCWDNLRVAQTTAWLEMTNAKVKKLSELVNQQPSSLNGEGSETKDETPLMGDDIVQTTTKG